MISSLSSIPKPAKLAIAGVTVLLVGFALVHLFITPKAKTPSGMWQQDHRGYRYRNADGSYITKSWATINGKQYYFDGNGYIVVNRWIGDSYVGKDGVKVSNTARPQKNTAKNTQSSQSSSPAKNPNWRSDATGTWYQNPDGSYPTKRWEKIDDKWYYFNDKGYLLTNQWIGDYYVGSDGIMLTSAATPDNYIVDSEGRWIRNINRTAVGVIREALRLHLSRAALMDAMQAKHISYEDSTTATDSLRIDFANHAKVVAQEAIDQGKGYSKRGLIKYLTTGLNQQHPGLRFTEDEATHAVAQVRADYTEQAKKKAHALAAADKKRSKSTIAKLLKDTYYFTQEEAQRGAAQ